MLGSYEKLLVSVNRTTNKVGRVLLWPALAFASVTDVIPVTHTQAE